jgi:hypothetical protein
MFLKKETAADAPLSEWYFHNISHAAVTLW